ncbi:MAG: ATP-binding protein [Bacteroidales bacterium]|nr:ATP-binding protein [Lachnoclostridium sp.]MCM1383085.1 ATP-binding protein [Lachnoclostridium sp.]MCM1463858.1 ATP-binding protein [Bacteroidales bacterium]
MKKKHGLFYLLIIVSASMILCLAAFVYIRQMNQTISRNIINSISEIAEHDKATIQTYIEICWKDLYEIQERFISFECKTLEDVETRMNLERASSDFTHIYLVAEDGTVYTDKYVVYTPGNDIVNRNLDFLPYFRGNEDKIVVRFDDKTEGGWLAKESILYGVRLKDYSIEGKKMFALIGISDISSIQDKMVIDSFIKDGKARGHSALVDMNGNYIVNINKEIYLNKQNNLYDHLTDAESSDLTNEEVKEKLKNRETFGFYHSHAGEKGQELYYFIPFEDHFDLYFIMSINEEVFEEQTRTFVSLSLTMAIVAMVTVILMLLVIMRLQIKTVRTTEAARSQKEFLSNMSHEIRTPLNGLIGMNHLIMANIDDEDQKPQIKEWLQKSHSTANYLLSLVNDILDMSKLQAGKVDIMEEPILLSALVDEVAAMQTDNIKNRGVEFIVEKDIIEPYIEGDITRTKQILMNIVGNAAKFTPEGKWIRLSVTQKKTDDMHVITAYCCEDAGIGISEEYIDKIFDSFSQERNRNTNGIKGTGLGMAISKLLANAMGGDITVESKVGVGSKFTVTIPSRIVKDIPEELQRQWETDETGNVSKAACRADGRPIKILVAEDVELNAEVLLEILKMNGFETALAQNGQEALDAFSQSEIGEFNIILMDMQMPVMDGCTAAERIRKLDRADAGSVIIYACTANMFQEDREQALSSGMDDFLTKPIDVEVLLKKLRKSEK